MDDGFRGDRKRFVARTTHGLDWAATGGSGWGLQFYTVKIVGLERASGGPLVQSQAPELMHRVCRWI